jgi:hypothetical protein
MLPLRIIDSGRSARARLYSLSIAASKDRIVSRGRSLRRTLHGVTQPKREFVRLDRLEGTLIAATHRLERSGSAAEAGQQFEQRESLKATY